jgi:hypothetical protein
MNINKILKVKKYINLYIKLFYYLFEYLTIFNTKVINILLFFRKKKSIIILN